MTKVIAIKPEYDDALTTALSREQVRCTARTINLFWLKAKAKSAEETLDGMGVSRAERVGCRCEFVDAVPHSYRYAAMSTRAVIRRLSTGYWALEVLSRERSPQQPGGGVRDKLYLTEAAKSSAVKALMRKHGVRDMPSKAA